MNTKAIRMPKGAAAEYAKYACNFFIGCSNQCTYCFNNRWGWGNVPKLKKYFKDEEHALQVFKKELIANLPELKKHGLFFTFTSDPMLRTTAGVTCYAVELCAEYDVPVTILTKVNFLNFFDLEAAKKREKLKKYVAFGFTLTGHDELETNASTNAERIEAMKKLHDAGFKTWASIEPVINTFSSADMILQTMDFCDLYKVGLMSKKRYEKASIDMFVQSIFKKKNNKFYLKDSLLKAAGINRSDLPANCVDRDFNLFNE